MLNITDPKVKALIFLLIASVLLAGVNMNVYVFEKKVPCPTPISCPAYSPLYNFETQLCYSYCAVGMCRSWNGTTFGTCVNCTQTSSARVKEIFNKAATIANIKEELNKEQNPNLESEEDLEEQEEENAHLQGKPLASISAPNNQEENGEEEEPVALRNQKSTLKKKESSIKK